MAATAFNSLSYSKQLQEAGVPEEQADMHATALTAVLESHLLTKEEFASFVARYEAHRIEDRAEWKGALREMDVRWMEKFTDLRNDMGDWKADLMKWMIIMWLTQIGAVAGLLALMR